MQLVRSTSSAAQCDGGGRAGEKWRRPKAGTSGACDSSGIRFYASRSQKADESAHTFAIAETLHHFAVVDGVASEGSDAGSACARFCAGTLLRAVPHAFHEQVRRVPLRAATQPDGSLFSDEAEAVTAIWAQALMSGFALCDEMAQQQGSEIGNGACGALLCVVAESGVYIASTGLGRVVIGTEDAGEVMVDEASNPHVADSDAEVARFEEASRSCQELKHPLGPEAPTRFLGGGPLKQAESLLVGLPDVVKHQHSDSRRFIILGSPGLWDYGPRLPVQWAIEAYKTGKNPADDLVARSRGSDVVALVLVLPSGLGTGDGRLPPHDELVFQVPS